MARRLCYTVGAKTVMIDPKNIEQVLDSLRQALPGGFARDVEKNLRAALTAALARLDLVTREEFEVQSQVLARTRAKLEALEKLVAELEQQLKR
jgi:BMFP domain-containing protein YqiC